MVAICQSESSRYMPLKSRYMPVNVKVGYLSRTMPVNSRYMPVKWAHHAMDHSRKSLVLIIGLFSVKNGICGGGATSPSEILDATWVNVFLSFFGAYHPTMESYAHLLMPFLHIYVIVGECDLIQRSPQNHSPVRRVMHEMLTVTQ